MRFPGRHIAVVASASLVAFALLLVNRIPRLSDAVHTDEADTLLMVQTLKSGGVMYRDLWNSHAPGMYFLTALLPEAVLRHEATFRLLSVAALAACALLIADLCVRAGLGFTATGLGAVIFALLNSNNNLLNHYMETEQFTALWLVLALWFIEAKKKPFAAWLVYGIALTFKQSNIAWLPILLLYDWARMMRGRAADVRWLLRCAAVALPGLMILGYFALKGALGDFLQNTWTDAIQHGRWQSGVNLYCDAWHTPLQTLAQPGGAGLFYTLLCGLACGAAAVTLLDFRRLPHHESMPLLAMAAALLAGGLLFLKIQHCGRIYYIETIYPAIFMISAWTIHRSMELCAQGGALLRRAAGAGTLLLLLLGVAVLAGGFSLQATDTPWEQRLSLDRFLARQMNIHFPGRTIYTATSQPGWYWYSGQIPPRYIWPTEFLENFPARREDIYRDAVEYGRGRKLLVLFYIATLRQRLQGTLIFRDRMIRAGATRFEPPDRDLHPVILQEYELYEWDLSGCGARPAPCPGHSSGS